MEGIGLSAKTLKAGNQMGALELYYRIWEYARQVVALL
jgi:hypothetical protein